MTRESEVMDLGELISKGIRNPTQVPTWLYFRLQGIYDEFVFTPRQSRCLFDEDWEVAVILDACRYDLAADRISSHSIGFESPEKVTSVSSWSPDWIRRTFGSASEDILEETAYITGNVFTNELPKSQLGDVDQVWQYGWDEELETVPPRPITDRAITAIREGEFDRYVVHYMQPHLPPIGKHADRFTGFSPQEGEPGEEREEAEWAAVKSGAIDPDVAREAYRENLDPVLDDLELLLDNIDASEVVVTADHGNYLGEKGRWGHPRDHIHPAVREVPWWETTATDSDTYTPERYDTEDEGTDRDEKLEALGYL